MLSVKKFILLTGRCNMGEVVRAVSEASNNEAVLVTDVGQNQMMAARILNTVRTAAS